MKMTSNQLNKIKDIIIQMIKVNIANLEFQKTMSSVKEHRKTFTKMIHHSEKSIEIVRNLKHNDILASIYNSFVFGKEAYFITLNESIYKNVQKWDATEKGYKEFKELERNAKEQSEKELQEKREMAETIKKAKENGQKIEYLFENGKIRPVVVEEKKN